MKSAANTHCSQLPTARKPSALAGMISSMGLIALVTALVSCSVVNSPSQAEHPNHPGAESEAAPAPDKIESVKGALHGDELRRYSFDVSENDDVYVQMVTDNSSNYFNISPANSREAIFIGSVEGQQFKRHFDEPGTFEVMVYLMRNAARRGESANFQLIVRGARALVDLNQKPRSGMHSSWDQDGDGINDCENDGSCDHTVDYSKPRF